MKHLTIKRFILCFIAFMSIAHLSAQSISNQTEPDSVKWERIAQLKNEATYRAQNKVMPRSSAAHPLTLGQQMQSLFKDGVVFTDAYICNLSADDKAEETYYPDAKALLDIDPITLAYDLKDSCLIQKSHNANISINLGYKTADGTKRYFTIYMRTLRNHTFCCTSCYVRMTYMVPEVGEDDKQTFESKSKPVIGSYVTAYDAKDTTAFMSLFSKTFESLKANLEAGAKESPTNEEYAVFLGLREQDSGSFDIQYAKSLYNDRKYYDAYVRLKNVFAYNRSYLHNGGKDVSSEFYDACYYLAECLERMGIHDESTYYMGLAANNNKRFKKEYDEMLSAEVTPWDIMDYQFADPKKKPVIDCVSAGQMLHSLYNVMPENLLYGVARVNDDAKTSSLSGQQAWDFNLKDLCTDQPSLLNIKYSHDCSTTKSTTDLSSSQFNNTIVISVHKISLADKLWRVDILVPNFNNFDTKREDTDQNYPLMSSFIIGNDRKVWNTKKLSDISDQCMSLANADRRAEAMNGYKYIYSTLKKKYAGKKMSEEDEDLCKLAGFWYGAALVELGNSIKAMNYITPNYNAAGIMGCREYVNALAGLQDPRTLDIIETDLKDVGEFLQKDSTNAELVSYRNFLLRRKAYVLIDQGELDAAEKVLMIAKEIDPSEDNQRRVAGELQYIKQLRDRNKGE